MKFRTELIPPPAPFRLDHQSRLLSLGSCFAEAMGSRLAQEKFPILVNPFGTLFNPLSIHQILSYGLVKTFPASEHRVAHSGQHFHYDFHSSFFAEDASTLDKVIKDKLILLQEYLAQLDCLVLTWGTAYAYSLKTQNKIVANCHKQPSLLFDKILLTPDEILASFHHVYPALKALRPHLKIILSISPVRHIKDGLLENSLSKAHLRMAAAALSQENEDIYYFPAYELLLDDLRDYRFYESDMLHPNASAQTYIWEKFKSTFFDPATLDLIKEWQKIQKALQHRPFHPESEAHQLFLKNILQKLELLTEKLDLSREIDQLKARLV